MKAELILMMKMKIRDIQKNGKKKFLSLSFLGFLFK
jgi:hypothetical protein